MNLYPPSRLGMRLADDDTLRALRVAAGGAGLRLGGTEAGEPVVIELFGSAPADYALIGGLPIRQLLAFRALALGAHVVVQTNRLSEWSSFGRVAAGTRGDLQCVTAISMLPPGHPNRPVLAILDNESSLGGNSRVAGPWSAVVSASDNANRWNVGDLTRVDLVLAASLPASAASLLGKALSLPDDGASLSGLAPGELSLIARGYSLRVSLQMTDAERWITSGAVDG